MPRLDKIRMARNRLLADSDRTQLPDYPLTDEQRAAWATYRQALRDLPAEGITLLTVTWPTPPSPSA